MLRTRVGRTLATVGAVAVVSATVACRPSPPRPVLAVTTTADGVDAAPGDGVCEATAGSGDCTLRAAVDEANALGRAAITVPAGTYTATRLATSTLVITGDVTINDGAPQDVELANQWIVVAAGGRLTLDGVRSVAFGGPRIVVDGAFRGRHLSLTALENVEPILDVRDGGVASLERSFLVNALLDRSPAVVNAGTLAIHYSTVATYRWSPPGIRTSLVTSGRTFARASVLSACAGTPPVSAGANAAVDSTCGLGAPDDRNVPDGLAFDFGPPVLPVLVPTSPLVDAIPAGSHGCGDWVTGDVLGSPRPTDGNGDGVAACDIGARERVAAP